MFIRKSLLQLGKFASSDAKRLLQQYRPVSAAPVCSRDVRYVRFSCRDGSIVGEAVHVTLSAHLGSTSKDDAARRFHNLETTGPPNL
jgi:hypothetical protein